MPGIRITENGEEIVTVTGSDFQLEWPDTERKLDTQTIDDDQLEREATERQRERQHPTT